MRTLHFIPRLWVERAAEAHQRGNILELTSYRTNVERRMGERRQQLLDVFRLSALMTKAV